MEIKKTGFGDFLIVLGWIHFGLSIVGGIFLLAEFSYNDALTLVAIGIGFAGCFMGLCIVGFGKIINYLNSINFYVSQWNREKDSNGQGDKKNISSGLPDL